MSSMEYCEVISTVRLESGKERIDFYLTEISIHFSGEVFRSIQSLFFFLVFLLSYLKLTGSLFFLFVFLYFQPFHQITSHKTRLLPEIL